MSVNEDIRDDLVAHDIDLRRVDGDVRNRIDKRLEVLGRELSGIIARHDPNGAVRKRTREKRTVELQKDARQTINEAFREIHAMLRAALKGVARLESTVVVDAISESLP